MHGSTKHDSGITPDRRRHPGRRPRLCHPAEPRPALVILPEGFRAAYGSIVGGRPHNEGMPGIRHQAVVQVLRDEPQLLIMLLRRLGVRLPSDPVPDPADRVLSSTDPDRLKELIADNVFVFRGLDKQVAVVFEVQTSRPKQDRKLAWPAYLTITRAIHKCDTMLCVIGLSADAVRGSAQLIRTGHPDFSLRPQVTGYGLLPAPGGAVFGAGLTVIKVMTRELDLTTHEGRMFTLTSLMTVPDHQRELYTRYIRAAVPPPIRKELNKLMSTVINDPASYCTSLPVLVCSCWAAGLGVAA